MHQPGFPQGPPPRRVKLGNLLLVLGTLILLVPVALLAINEVAYRIQMAQAPTPSPVLLSPLGQALTETPAATGEAVEARAETEQPASRSPGDLPIVRFDRSQPPPSYQIEIPRIGIAYLVGEGVDDPILASGPGHYPQTALPGEVGNAALAGHRTVRGRPAFFYRLNELEAGDEIRIGYQDQTLVFEVERVFLTSPYDLSVLQPTPHPSLTLTTCDPPGSDEMRLIVQARLVPGTASSHASK